MRKREWSADQLHGASRRVPPRVTARRATIALLPLLQLAVLAGGSGAGAAQDGGQPVVIDFDDYPANISGSPAAPAITGAYAERGVLFPNGVTALRFDDTSFPPRPDLPRSPANVITTCYSAEFCSSGFTMEFTRSVELLTLYVGYAGPLDAPAELVIEAFDESGTTVAASSVVVPAADAAQPAAIDLTVSDPTGSITRAVVGWADPSRFLGRLIADDLTLVPFVARPELASDPALLELAATDSVVERTLTVVNTGNVGLFDVFVTLDEEDVTGAGAAIDLRGDIACLGFMAPGERCELVVLLGPGEDGTVTGVLTMRGPTGAPLLEVPLRATVVQPIPPTEIPPTPTEPPATPTSATTTPTAAPEEATPTATTPPVPATAAPGGDDDDGSAVGQGGSPGGGDDPGSGSTVVLVAIIAAVVAGVLGFLARGRWRRPPAAVPAPVTEPRPTPPARYSIRAHFGAEQLGFAPGAGPSVSLRASFADGATTNIGKPRASDEGD